MKVIVLFLILLNAKTTLAEEKFEFIDDGLLDLEQYEKLSLFDHGVAVSLGRAIPWQKLSLSYYQKKSAAGDRFLTFSLGGGSFTMEGEYEDLSYKVETDAYNVFGSYRYYFTEFSNFYLEPKIGIAYWTGETKASGIDHDKAEAIAMFDNKFTTAGVITAGNFGILWLFSNGFFIDYSILRMSLTVPLYADFKNDNDGESVTQAQIIGPHLWGSANLTLGYMF